MLRRAGITSPTLHNVPAAFHYYGAAVYDMVGPVLSIAAMAAAAYLVFGYCAKLRARTYWCCRAWRLPGCFQS